MKKIYITLIGVIFSFLFCQCSKKEVEIEPAEGELIIIEGCCYPEVSDMYSFPIKYETEEWYKLDIDERLGVCQLPDNVLKSISTLGLIRSFIDLPHSFYFTYLTSSTWKRTETAKRLFKLFNCVQELLNRKDNAKSLIAFYAAIKLDCVESLYSNGDNDREFEYRLITLQCLFTMPEILNKLSREDKKTVVESLLANYRQWNQWGSTMIHPLLSIMTWLMYDDMLPFFDEDLLIFIKQVVLVPDDTCDEIIAFAEKFILM